MNSYPPAGRDGDLISSLHFDNFEVSWAGAGPGNGGFCFGSEDGELLFTDEAGTHLARTEKVIASGEAINGVAFLDRWMAVSTRGEIVFTLTPQQGNATPGVPVPLGAHDVIVGKGGYFFAPLGRRGVLSCLPTDGPVQKVTVSAGLPDQVYCYRVISLQTPGGQEILAFAARHGGIAAMEFGKEDGKHPLSTLTFNGLDVVDICPLAGERSTAAAALGRDGTLILFRDVLQERKPATVRYAAVRGVAYRLLSAGGNLFLLTSEALYVITELIDFVLSGTKGKPVTPVLQIGMEAVDANVVGEKWVLITLPDQVLRFDVELLQQARPTDFSAGEKRDLAPAAIEPVWEQRSFEQSALLMGT